MKKKVLAILMGAVMSVSCISLFAACTGKDGGKNNAEQSGKEEESTGNQSGTDEHKTTVDNFEEWWQAIKDSFGSDNFIWNVETIIGEEKETMSCERQGETMHRSCMSFETNHFVKEFYAKLIEEEPAAMEMYDYCDHISLNSEDGYWRKIWQSFEGDEDMEYFFSQPYSKPYMHNLVILTYFWDIEYLSTLMGFCGVKFEDYFCDEEPTEETMKLNAEEVYQSVSYDPKDDSYHFRNQFDFDIAIKFLDRKISKLCIEENYSDMSNSIMVLYMTYGNSNVTIPDEVVTSANETAARSVLAESLNGTYSLRKADGSTSTLKIYFSSNNVWGSGYYENDIDGDKDLLDIPQSFTCELISEDSIFLTGKDSNDDWEEISLSIEQGSLLYTADDGTKHRFVKCE